MQEALPYKAWPATTTSGGGSASLESPLGHDDTSKNDDTSVHRLVSENRVIVFGRRGCCMCHVVKRLLLGHGVNPTIFGVDDQDESSVIDELSRVAGEEERPQFPVVFVGGKLFGGLEKVMAAHISESLPEVFFINFRETGKRDLNCHIDMNIGFPQDPASATSQALLSKVGQALDLTRLRRRYGLYACGAITRKSYSGKDDDIKLVTLFPADDFLSWDYVLLQF
ncbi:hypothetical protein RJ640_030027 [Escallonia rubra]|uniref:Glutaredoxin domain-containing protein n=1 Tax=Escallonia rubra TaxID=112253 RepID=A0AA88RM58_9ASTE|nr:hypothetical protein RJ640_030027 [Escallonia rubra]